MGKPAQGESDAGPVWYTEAAYQQSIGEPLEPVAIPEVVNVQTTSVAAAMKNAPRPQAAKDFLSFINWSKAQAIYRKFGFEP